MVLTIYVFEISPPCRAVLMTLKYLNIPAELKEANSIVGKSKNHQDFLKINPRLCVPTIDDDGFHLWESRAIMTYLANQYAPDSPIYPKRPKDRARVDMMLNYDQGTIYRAHVEYLYPMIFRGEDPDPYKEAAYVTSLQDLERHLADMKYMAGDHITLADFSIVASISLAEAYAIDLSGFPSVLAWLDKMKREIPSYDNINVTPLRQFRFWYEPYLHGLVDRDMYDGCDSDVDVETKM